MIKTKLVGYIHLWNYLKSQGFKREENTYKSRENYCNWYAYKKIIFDAEKCETDDTAKHTQIIVNPYIFPIDNETSIEVTIINEVNGIWFEQKAYNLNYKELTENLEKIEKMLINALNALSLTTLETRNEQTAGSNF